MGDKRLIDNEWLTMDECYEKHKRLITILSKRYRKMGIMLGMDYEDIRGFVYIGFTKAYMKFDQEQGFKFSTFFARWAFGEVSHGARGYGKGIHFTRDTTDNAARIIREELQEEPIESIAQKMEVSETEAFEALEFLNYSSKSFDAPFINPMDNSETSYHDLYGKTQDHFPIYWNEFVSNLTDEEKNVITLRKQDKNQKSIGEELGYKQVEISRKLKKIQQKYKQYQKGQVIS